VLEGEVQVRSIRRPAVVSTPLSVRDRDLSGRRPLLVDHGTGAYAACHHPLLAKGA